MMKTWLTSDTHFGHINVLRYCNRPFSSIQEHDDALIDAWNSVVSKDDHVYHLGDFTLGNNAGEYFIRLNGHVHVLCYPWHHDKRWIPCTWIGITDYETSAGVRVGLVHPMLVWEDVDTNEDGRGVPLTLCHYPLLSFDRQHYGAYHCFGHAHNALPKRKNCLDVGVDSAYKLLGEYRPFSLKEALNISGAFSDLIPLDDI